MLYYHTWFIVFVFITYLIATDSSVAKLFTLSSKIIKFQYEKTKWWALHNPANPLIKWMMWRRSLKMAEELQKDLMKKK
jgi:hypothetical protein